MSEIHTKTYQSPQDGQDFLFEYWLFPFAGVKQVPMTLGDLRIVDCEIHMAHTTDSIAIIILGI